MQKKILWIGLLIGLIAITISMQPATAWTNRDTYIIYTDAGKFSETIWTDKEGDRSDDRVIQIYMDSEYSLWGYDGVYLKVNGQPDIASILDGLKASRDDQLIRALRGLNLQMKLMEKGFGKRYPEKMVYKLAQFITKCAERQIASM